MSAWKDAEREVAEYFGGYRRVRVSYNESCGDIIHPTLSIEVKYGKQIPKRALLGKSCQFLVHAFNQARGYDPTKIAVVCLKYPHRWGFIYITVEHGRYRRHSSMEPIPAYLQSPEESHHQPTT